MTKPDDFGLKQNPFHLVANDEVAKHWAGRPQIKRLLQDVIHSVLPEDIGSSEFVIIYGDWGSGRTHALRYFQREIRNQGHGHVFFASKVRLGATLSFKELFCSIVKDCNEDFFKNLVESIRRSVKNEMVNARIADQEPIINEKIPENYRALVKKILNVEQIEVKSIFLKVDNDYSAASMMTDLMRIMTMPIGNQDPPYKAVYLFLDEVEETFEAKPAQSVPFWSGCRELVNRMPEHSALILSFTGEAALLEAIIPPHLMERMTRPRISFEQFTDESAKEFIRELLSFVRIEEFTPSPRHNPDYYPFSEEAIGALLAKETNLVPRRIIENMRYVFERATRHEKVSPGEEITDDLVHEILKDKGY